MKLFIKYMVSQRCKILVKEELAKIGISKVLVDLGMIDILEEITDEQLDKLRESLLKTGLELLDDKKVIIVKQIKSLIIEMIHYDEDIPHIKASDYISQKLHYNYTYLSNIFSEVRGITIQQYIILQKIEKVKELLLYDESNLSEIAFDLNFSSVAHLSNQFKKITGLTPSYFKKLKMKRKHNLEDV